MTEALATTPIRVALCGFGEAASAFASGWQRDIVASMSAYDEKIADAAERDALEARARSCDVVLRQSAAEAFSDADVAVSLVYADRAVDAARDTARALKPGALYIDGNSCAPHTKRQAAEALLEAGVEYIDMAIMAPVHPRKEKTPVLLSGPGAERAARLLQAMGMEPRVVGDEIGQASTIKLTRSIMIKGLEALMAECFLTARTAGIEDEIIASLEASDPDIAWRQRRDYAMDRMTVHGGRRAAEMVESAAMVAELGLFGDMAAASARWQSRLGALPITTSDIGAVLDTLGKEQALAHNETDTAR